MGPKAAERYQSYQKKLELDFGKIQWDILMQIIHESL